MKYNFCFENINLIHEEICIPSFHKYYDQYKEEYGFTYKSSNVTNESTNYGTFWDSVDNYLKLNNYEFDCRYPESPWIGMWLRKKYPNLGDHILFLDGSIKKPKVSSNVKDLFNTDLHKKYIELKIKNSIKRFFLLGGIDIHLLIIDNIYKFGFNYSKEHYSESRWENVYEDLLKHYSGQYGRLGRFDYFLNSHLFTKDKNFISIPLIGLNNYLEYDERENNYREFINNLRNKTSNPGYINSNTSYSRSNRELFCFTIDHFDNIQYHNIVPKIYYNEFIDTFRNPENEIRTELGLPKIGEGWISETKLFYLIKERFKEFRVIQHGKPKWLGKQHLDIYIPELNVGIEYQGEQHSISVDIFGGEDGLTNNIERDRRKKKLCELNDLQLFEVYPDDDFYLFVDKLSELFLE